MTETLPPKLRRLRAWTLFATRWRRIPVCKNPVSDAYAISAMRLIGEYLEKPSINPRTKSKDSHGQRFFACGIAFSNSMVGLVHAIGHAAGGVSHIPHGNAMAILLPHVMEFNMPKCEKLYGDVLLYLFGPKFTLPRPPKKGAGCAWKRYAKCSIGLTKMRFAHEVEG